MVLDEADEARLVRGVGRQVAAYRRGVVVLEAVVETLVVAVVEPLLLELPLEIPVRLGHEDEVGMLALHGGDDRGPVVRVRPRAGALAPGARERLVHHQHGHVAAHAVALRGDRLQGLDRGRSLLRRERVQLDDVRPGREERVATASKDRVARRARTRPGRAPDRPRRRARSTRDGRPSTDGRARRGWARSRGSARARARRARRGPWRGPTDRRGARRRCSCGCSTASRRRPR